MRATTGLVLDPYFSATKAAWLLRHGDLALTPDSPDLSFCTVDTWVLWNLTGGPGGGTYATDPSNASRTLLLDTATLSWSPELCDAVRRAAAHPRRKCDPRRAASAPPR